MRLAVTTFTILHEPYGHERVEEFDDLTPVVFRRAERSEGFIARAVELDDTGTTNFDANWGEWGRFDVPRFYNDLGREADTDQRASTLSLWVDLQSAFNFAYSDLHAHAVSRRSEWFKKPNSPTYACWWVDNEEIPTWSNACEKLELLHDKGPTVDAFSFRHCFDVEGNVVRLSKSKSK